MSTLSRRLAVVLLVGSLAVGAGGAVLAGTTGRAGASSPRTPTTAPDITPTPLPHTPPVSSCPWLRAAIDRHQSPAALADLVLGRMTLAEKLGEIALISSHGYENLDAGVPRRPGPGARPGG